ncbi:MAG: hypothetical protein PHF86_13790 [Candidatus Nanoarchaeia archaeon]|nr:hypothetical protein [Candidatus Nanoarchaeia archaeon]
MVNIYYPKIDILDGMAAPIVRLPKEYLKFIPNFYKNNGKEEVTKYSEDLISILNVDLRLNWDDKLGLRNIGLNGVAGFDLDEEVYQYVSHNIYSLKQAVPVFLVATKYISML